MSVEKEIFEYRGERVLALTLKLLGEKRKLPDWITPRLGANIFYILYLPYPEPREEAASIEEKTIINNIINNPMLWKVKPYTVADRITSTVASSVFLSEIVRMLGSASNQQSTIRNDREDRGEGENTENKLSNSTIERAVSSALSRASQASRSAKDIVRLASYAQAGSGSSLSFEGSIEAILELSTRTDVSRVLELLSAVRVSRRTTRNTVKFSRGWLSGIEIGDDVERVHYSRLALPDELFLAELANSQLLIYQKELYGDAGHIYVLIDKSGSMTGRKMDWARAVALALLRRSRVESRRFSARFFDSITYRRVDAKPVNKPYEIISIIKYLASVRPGGGTDITRSVATAVEDVCSDNLRGVSDIVLVTDGEDKLSTHILEGLLNKCRIKLHTVLIEGDNPALKSVSSSYMRVDKLDSKEILRVIDF